MIPKKIASRITAVVMIILTVSIIFLVGVADLITKNFYADHLAKEVKGRVVSHAHLLEKNVDPVIVEYIDDMEAKKNSYTLIFDANLSILEGVSTIPESKFDNYLSWINENQNKATSINKPYIQHVSTTNRFHIPHIWALMPVFEDGNGEVVGYVFLDQDTGDLNRARVQLLLLLAIMGFTTFIIGFLFTNYISKRISKPLNHISEMTKNIAEGDLDISLNVRGGDEVGHLAESIQAMTNQLKEYRDSRRHFISHISHDLRTPITYIKGYAAVMKEAPLSDGREDWKRNLNVIYKEATRMEHLVSDLFLLTKLEEGKIKLDLEAVPVSNWIKHLYESRALMFDQKSLKHQLFIAEECKSMTVPMDAYRMEQALINVIENAIRHTPQEGEITIFLEKKGTEVIFSIKDTGVGISTKDLPHIWERFYKADTSRNRVQSGTGLGLAIVKEIVEAHKGKVLVNSTLSEGTTFSLFLPIQTNET